MPLYEFQCFDCGDRFEVLFRSSSERKRPVCEGCGSRSVGKVLSTFGIGVKSGRSSGAGSHSSGGCGPCKRHSCAGCK